LRLSQTIFRLFAELTLLLVPPLEAGVARVCQQVDLVQAFLDFARPPTPEKRTFDVCELLIQTVELVSGRATQQKLELVREIPHEPMRIEGDPAQIRQVVLNLLLNAFDAMSDGGRVVVKVERRAGLVGEEPVRSGVDTVLIRISDTGPGLRHETIATVFDPFVTTKETGTGLGLTITRRIVEAHGGAITAENSIQGGAVFTVRLPVSQSDKADEAVEIVRQGTAVGCANS
jgi:signal transduction histidine kinase